MRASKFFISTLKETPVDAEIISYQLMIRAGIIKQVAPGIFTYMPIGLRIIRKVEAIIREEMNRTGAIELLMPLVQPAELWEKSGRWNTMGPELMRIKDRYGHNFVIQPTSEEVMIDVVGAELRSYKQLPISFYHIQTKFRDERRPRFGLIRSREFIMKDAYSFDSSVNSMKKSYQIMYDAYSHIFNRFNLQFIVVSADNGTIGGFISHEFHAIAVTGEDKLVYCQNSNYAANIETAEAPAVNSIRDAATAMLTKIAIHGKSGCNVIAAFLSLPPTYIIKSIVLITELNKSIEKEIWLLLLRSDHELNKIKVNKIIGSTNYRFANEKEIIEWFGTSSDYLGPIGINKSIKVLADRTVFNMSNFVCGANETNFYFIGVNWIRDLPEPFVGDIRNVVEGDISPDGKGVLTIKRGIEIGHIFQLGTIYSKSMKATFLDANGKLCLLKMGCYGIGITRILCAAIEQNFDTKGIIWPLSLAPFSVVLCPIEYNHQLIKLTVDKLYKEFLQADIEVLLDDRGERFGSMLTDWELIGIPHRIIISIRTLQEKCVEYQNRREMTSILVDLSKILSFIQKKII